MDLKPVFTPQAPQPIGPYSQAMWACGFLFTSGQLGINPQTGKLCQESLEEEFRQALANLREILQVAGADFSGVVSVNIYLTNLAEFAKVNQLYAEAFGPHHPARTTVEVTALPLGARIEISLIAWVG